MKKMRASTFAEIGMRAEKLRDELRALTPPSFCNDCEAAGVEFHAALALSYAIETAGSAMGTVRWAAGEAALQAGRKAAQRELAQAGK